jgi:hypothetical protein
MLAGDGEDWTHLARQTGVMHWHDCLGARRYRGLEALNVDVERNWIDVDEDRVCTQVTHHLYGGRERQRRGDNLITRTDANRFKRQVQSGGRTIYSQAM